MQIWLGTKLQTLFALDTSLPLIYLYIQFVGYQSLRSQDITVADRRWAVSFPHSSDQGASTHTGLLVREPSSVLPSKLGRLGRLQKKFKKSPLQKAGHGSICKNSSYSPPHLLFCHSFVQDPSLKLYVLRSPIWKWVGKRHLGSRTHSVYALLHRAPTPARSLARCLPHWSHGQLDSTTANRNAGEGGAYAAVSREQKWAQKEFSPA